MKRSKPRSQPSTTHKVGWGRERWVIIWRAFTSWPGYPLLTAAWLLAYGLWVTEIVPDLYGEIAVRLIGYITMFAIIIRVRLYGTEKQKREFARPFQRAFWPVVIGTLVMMGIIWAFGH